MRRISFMKRIGLTVVLPLLLLSAFPSNCWAWGDHGHQIVVLIASRYLNAQAQENVLRLLMEDIRVNDYYYKAACPDVLALSKTQPLSEVHRKQLLTEGLRCMVIWPDPPYVKFDRPYTANWHFIDIPLTHNPGGKATTYQLDLARECLLGAKSGDCALLALERFEAVLANPRKNGNYGESDASRAEALKFIIHIVGDIHQPLHCANDQDLSKPDDHGDAGGNGKIVNWLNEQTYKFGVWNLHAVWDSGILDKTLAAYKDKNDLSIEEAFIRDSGLPAAGSPDLARMQEGSVFAWVYQSYQLAAEYVYGKLPPYDANYEYPVLDRKTFKPVIDPATNKPKTNFGGYRLTEEYYSANAPVVKRQLILGGVRLGRILNEDLGK